MGETPEIRHPQTYKTQALIPEPPKYPLKQSGLFVIQLPEREKKEIFFSQVTFSYKKNLFTPGNSGVYFGNTNPASGVTNRTISAVFNTIRK